MKIRYLPRLAVVFCVLLLALALLCFTPAKTVRPQAAPAPVVEPPSVTVVDSLPEMPLEARSLIFYPPGKAPSEDMEFEPIPFESLLPGTENNDPIPVDNG